MLKPNELEAEMLRSIAVVTVAFQFRNKCFLTSAESVITKSTDNGNKTAMSRELATQAAAASVQEITLTRA